MRPIAATQKSTRLVSYIIVDYEQGTIYSAPVSALGDRLDGYKLLLVNSTRLTTVNKIIRALTKVAREAQEMRDKQRERELRALEKQMEWIVGYFLDGE